MQKEYLLNPETNTQHKPKIKLLWIIDSLGRGGAENLMPTILGNIDKNRFDQRVCVLQDRDGNPVAGELQAIGIPVDFVPVPRLRNLSSLPRLLFYLRKEKPDIVHTQLEFSATLGCLATRLLGIPNVSTFHVIHDPGTVKLTRWRYKFMWASYRYFANLILAVSDSVRNNIIEAGKIPPSKVFTLHNGIELERFSEISPDIANVSKKDFGIPENSIVLITVAVLRPPKGIQYILEAIPQILEEIPNAYYLIVGDGEHRNTLEEKAETLKISGHIRFAGYRSDIPELLALSDIFILPTLNDAFPTVLIEAMAAGKPVIASKIGGVPEIVQETINGILLPPGNPDAIRDACIRLIQDKELSERFAKASVKIANEKFGIMGQVKKLEQLYTDLTHK